jgi:hypothetical protein
MRTLPVSGTDANGKRLETKDHRDLFGKAARDLLAAIEKEDGIDFAESVFRFASTHKFWSTLPIIPARYVNYKSAMPKGAPVAAKAESFERVMKLVGGGK